jgi:hypothetical protein
MELNESVTPAEIAADTKIEAISMTAIAPSSTLFSPCFKLQKRFSASSHYKLNFFDLKILVKIS